MDFQKAVELIKKAKQVLLTTHTRPDGDACGCIVAMSEALTTLGKNVKILLLSELPGWYEFLFEQWFDRLTILSGVEGKPEFTAEHAKHAEKQLDIKIKNSAVSANSAVKHSDLIIIVDTDTYNQLPGLDKYLKEFAAVRPLAVLSHCRSRRRNGSDKPVLVIDHHVSSDNLGDVRLIDNSAAATALIVFDLLKYAGFPVTKKIADALFVAVSTDTGWFRFGNTDSRVLRVCAELIEAGASPSRVYHDLYQNFSPQRFKLMAAMLNTLELHLGGRFAMQHLTQRDFEQTGAKFSDTENLIDECRRISSVEAAALFVEQADGKVKVSLRSRGAIDVCKIAEKFGGGGHKMAAGAYLPGPIENAKKLILAEMTNQFK